MMWKKNVLKLKVILVSEMHSNIKQSTNFVNSYSSVFELEWDINVKPTAYFYIVEPNKGSLWGSFEEIQF